VKLYNVFTPTRNAVDLSMHRSIRETHKYMKEHEDRYEAVIENHVLDGATTITLMKPKHRYV